LHINIELNLTSILSTMSPRRFLDL